MSLKFKSILVAFIIILCLLLTNLNYRFIAESSYENLNCKSNARFFSYRNENFQWSEIEVISEPIFGQDINLNRSWEPEVAVENGNIYVVWMDNTSLNNAGGDWDICYRYYNGISWSDIEVISEPILGSNINTWDARSPDIAVENGNIYVVWDDYNNINNAGLAESDIFIRCNLSGDGWEDIQVISEPVFNKNYNIASSADPAIDVENNKIYVVWEDTNNTNGAESDQDIFFRCNLTGSGWENIQVISEPTFGMNKNDDNSRWPAIAVENDNIYTVWQDHTVMNGAGAEPDVFYRTKLFNSDWDDIQIISEPVSGSNQNNGDSWNPKIDVENNKIFVVWGDETNYNNAGTDIDIFFRCNLNNNYWEEIQVISEPKVNNNYNMMASWRPSIAVENDKIYIVWEEWNNTNGAGTDVDIVYRNNLTGYSWEDMKVASEPIEGIDVNIYASIKPDIEVEFGKCYFVWEDANNTNGAGINFDIHYRSIMNLAPNLVLPNVSPIIGNTSSHFNFTVTYIHANNIAPVELKLNIKDENYSMNEVDIIDNTYWDGKEYFLNISNLDIGIYTSKFWASDGSLLSTIVLANAPIVYNTPPNILTENNLTAIEDLYYEVKYFYEDIDIINVGQVADWILNTNAKWLFMTEITGVLNGTPINDDVGNYWVNISVNDAIDMDFTNFTLTVLNVNDDPKISTTNIEITHEDELYEVDYNATDVDSVISDLIWTLDTNGTSWLDFDKSTGIISGSPTNDEVGVYWVNISVIDSDEGSDFTNFTLTVLNVNDPPEITTDDILRAYVNKLYEVDYNASDIDSPLSQLVWSLDTNATWLDIDSSTGVISGIPLIDDLGWFNVNISVNDGDGGQNWHEFFLVVFLGNLAPEIITEDVLSATVDELYRVDYNATDVDTPIDDLIWSLNSNATWLDITASTGVLSGTPELKDVGSYWVKVSVYDGKDGWDFTNFTLWVTTEAITKFPPKLSNPSISPTTGDTNTEFTFSVGYSHPEGDLPDTIQVIIDENANNMESTNGHYEYSTKLSEGDHTYYFTTTLGNSIVNTDEYQTGHINKSTEVESDDGDGDEDNTMLFAGIGIIVIIIVVLILLFIFLKKKKGKEEEAPVEEAPPPPPEEVPPETPPPEQPPIPEVTPEQPPTPEVTAPQVEPQVEPAPEPAPMPLVEEQPVPQPQVEPQPQVKVQEPPVVEQPAEPQGQALVPKIKNSQE